MLPTTFCLEIPESAELTWAGGHGPLKTEDLATKCSKPKEKE